ETISAGAPDSVTRTSAAARSSSGRPSSSAVTIRRTTGNSESSTAPISMAISPSALAGAANPSPARRAVRARAKPRIQWATYYSPAPHRLARLRQQVGLLCPHEREQHAEVQERRECDDVFPLAQPQTE